MRIVKWLFVFLLISAFQCSSNEEVEPNTDATPITAVAMPEQASVGTAVTVEVSFTVYNGCGRFSRFSQTRSDNTFTVAVHPEYVGEGCIQALQTLKENFTFTPTQKGTYTFKFWQGNNEPYLERTITVQ